MVEEVLPDVPYAQIVYTMPKILRKAFLFRRELYGELCRAAYSATRDFLQEHFPRLKDAVPAMVAAPQSFGSLLHPHALHVSELESGQMSSANKLSPRPMNSCLRRSEANLPWL